MILLILCCMVAGLCLLCSQVEDFLVFKLCYGNIAICSSSVVVDLGVRCRNFSRGEGGPASQQTCASWIKSEILISDFFINPKATMIRFLNLDINI